MIRIIVLVLLMASFLPATSPVSTQKVLGPTTVVIAPITAFNVISGHLNGTGANITTVYQRNRAALIHPAANVTVVTIDFRITGPTAIVATDVDGIVRKGVTIWPNYQDPCNQYFLAWRADSSKPAGTSVLGAQLVHNPGLNMLSQCPGTGFSPLKLSDGTNAFRTLNIDIMDGLPHQLKMVRNGNATFQLFTDGVFQFEVTDPNATLPDIGLYGLRTDNVIVSLTYQMELPIAQATEYCANLGACFQGIIGGTGGGSGGNKFQLSVQVFDADGGNEETLAVNTKTVVKFPSTTISANAHVFTTFTFNVTSFIVSGTNTAKFTHASWDCSVNDNIMSFTITQNGAVIFSDPAVHTFNCTTPVTYAFNIGAPPPPSALVTSFTFIPIAPTVGQTATFTASATGGTSPYTFAWAFNDGTTGTGQTVTHAFPAGFDYNVTLTVTDAQPKTASVTNVVSISPPASFIASFTWTTLRPHTGNTVTFTSTFTGGVGPYAVTWSFGDGSTGTGLTTTHAFAVKGIYLVMTTVTDSIGETVSITRQLTVRP